MFKSLVASVRNGAKEFSELERIFQSKNKRLRTLTFYAESSIFYRYYEDYIQYVIANSDLDICYVCSDASDPLLTGNHERIKPFYIKNSLAALFNGLDSKVIVIATPDLNRGIIKRAPPPVHHLYAFRGISSTHQGYRLGAFDHYDSMLCVAQYQIDEIRKTEEIYGLKRKQLILTGYPLLERIYREHKEYRANHKTSTANPVCLIAPTWDPVSNSSSILDTCIYPLIDSLAKSKFTVWIRPHPEYLKRFPRKIGALQRCITKYPNMSLNLDLSSMQILHEADYLITDHSSIGVDFALATERPVLYIDTPLRWDNPERDRLDMPAVETVYRERLGARLTLHRVSEAGTVLLKVQDELAEFKKRVPALRNELVANWQKASQVGGDYIISLCSR
jgi:YidC/Oxa1 family membrane protein insertase